MQAIDAIINKTGWYDLTFNYTLVGAHTLLMRIYKHTNNQGGRELIYDRRVPCPGGDGLISGDVFYLESATYQINVEFHPEDYRPESKPPNYHVNYNDISINPPILKDDVIMIVAPHQDDETILYSHIMAKAIKENKVVKVVYPTIGGPWDINERLQETAVVLNKFFGITKRDMIIMGYSTVEAVYNSCGGNNSTNCSTNKPCSCSSSASPCVCPTYRKCTGDCNDSGMNHNHQFNHGRTRVIANHSGGFFEFDFLHRGGNPRAAIQATTPNGVKEVGLTRNNMRRDFKDIIDLYRPSEIFTTCEYDGTPNPKYDPNDPHSIRFLGQPDHCTTYLFLYEVLCELKKELKSYSPKLNYSAVNGYGGNYPGNSSNFPNPYPNGQNQNVSTTPNAIWLNRKLGGTIPSNPGGFSAVNFINGNIAGNISGRAYVVFNVLSLIAGTSIKANEIYGIEVTTQGEGSSIENRQMFIDVRTPDSATKSWATTDGWLSSPMFHAASAYNEARIWAIMEHGNTPNNGGRTQRQLLRYINQYDGGTHATNHLVAPRPFVLEVNPWRFEFRLRANDLHPSAVRAIVLLGKHRKPLGVIRYSSQNTNDNWEQFEEYHNKVTLKLDCDSITRANKLSALKGFETQTGKNPLPDHWLLLYAKNDEYYWTKDFANIAFLADVNSNSENTTTGQHAKNAVNGVISGHDDHNRLNDGTPYPYLYQRQEWAALTHNPNLPKEYIELNFDTTYSVKQINLYDRINMGDNIISGKLIFNDNNLDFINVGALPPNGAKHSIVFPSAKNVSRVRFEIENRQGERTGLAEIEVIT
jgi:hypothetical protein